MSRAHIGWFAALSLVVLRLAVGWHFLSEGGKKLTYDPETGRYEVTFSAEGFLAGAKGPLAGLMQNFALGDHRWRELLSVARQDVPLTADQEASRAEWAYDYKQRRDRASEKEKPVPIELPDFAPYHAWGTQVVDDWRGWVDDAADSAILSDEQQIEFTDAFHAHHQQLADYLASIGPEISEYHGG